MKSQVIDIALLALLSGPYDPSGLRLAIFETRVDQCENYLWASSEKKAQAEGWSLGDVPLAEQKWFSDKVHDKCVLEILEWTIRI